MLLMMKESPVCSEDQVSQITHLQRSLKPRIRIKSTILERRTLLLTFFDMLHGWAPSVHIHTFPKASNDIFCWWVGASSELPRAKGVYSQLPAGVHPTVPHERYPYTPESTYPVRRKGCSHSSLSRSITITLA